MGFDQGDAGLSFSAPGEGNTGDFTVILKSSILGTTEAGTPYYLHVDAVDGHGLTSSAVIEFYVGIVQSATPTSSSDTGSTPFNSLMFLVGLVSFAVIVRERQYFRR